MRVVVPAGLGDHPVAAVLELPRAWARRSS
jgi:hypothetical protein